MPHPWVQAWAIVALAFYSALGAGLVIAYLFPWLCSLLGPFAWSPAPVGA